MSQWYDALIDSCALFTAIGNAFAVLSDAEKRKQYDLYGAEGPMSHRRESTANQYDYAYTRGFESKLFFYEVPYCVKILKSI